MVDLHWEPTGDVTLSWTEAPGDKDKLITSARPSSRYPSAWLAEHLA